MTESEAVMNYKQMLQAVDTEKVFTLLSIGYRPQGAYFVFDCPQCEGKASIKIYGDSKNLLYCPTCKKGGHIISVVMAKKGVEWDEAVEFLTAKAFAGNAKKIVEELTLDYELVYHDFIKNKGISEEACKLLGIGVPKGKHMLAGCVAFTVISDSGLKVAYYGIRMKDGKAVFHKSFNPEYYLYNLNNVNNSDIVYFHTDIFECVKMIEQGKQSIFNFGLPYLSKEHLVLLDDMERIIFKVKEALVNSMAVQLAQQHKQLYKFEH
jgi:CHC2 zinc finger